MWSRHVTLWCDYDGGRDRALEVAAALEGVDLPSARGCVIWTDHGASGVEETRALAKKQGWLYVEAKDLCPEHARLDPDGRAYLERVARAEEAKMDRLVSALPKTSVYGTPFPPNDHVRVV